MCDDVRLSKQATLLMSVSYALWAELLAVVVCALHLDSPYVILMSDKCG